MYIHFSHRSIDGLKLAYLYDFNRKYWIQVILMEINEYFIGRQLSFCFSYRKFHRSVFMIFKEMLAYILGQTMCNFSERGRWWLRATLIRCKRRPIRRKQICYCGNMRTTSCATPGIPNKPDNVHERPPRTRHFWHWQSDGGGLRGVCKYFWAIDTRAWLKNEEWRMTQMANKLLLGLLALARDIYPWQPTGFPLRATVFSG